MKLSGWLLSAVLLYFLVGTLDYRDELEHENEALKAKLETMIPRPVMVNPLCPSGIWVSQRIDKRRGERIVYSRWRHNCVR